jgi:AcrR family transcriptional regulator
MKTIRQIADEIGVSTQAVYKRYKGKLHTVCAPYAHTEQGVLYLSEQAETLIKQDFLKADRSNGAHTERPIGAVSEQLKEADVVSVLQATIDTLQEQLEVKDQQIEKLTEALLALPDMLVVVWDLIPCLFLPGVVCLQCLVEDLMVDLFQIIVAKSHILLRPAPVYIRR